MAKGLHISRTQLEDVINANYTLDKIELINPAQGFIRYHLVTEEKNIVLNVYYTKKGTATVQTNCENGQELEQMIINSMEYKDVINGSFSTNITEKTFLNLIQFLSQLSQVEVSDPDEKGINGIIYKVKTDFGDSVTLTYFKTTSKMLYQGRLMKLYSIVKSYLIPLDSKIIETIQTEQTIEGKIQQQLKTHFPHGWTELEPTIQGFIKDSFSLLEVNVVLNDYAAPVMPVMRVLEYRIKKICADYDVIIDDAKGFKYYTNSAPSRNNDWIFDMDFSRDVVRGINSNISSMPPQAADVIVECYEFLRKNRHEMFHATQILSGMKLVGTKAEALQTIIETCEHIERSLTYNNV